MTSTDEAPSPEERALVAEEEALLGHVQRQLFDSAAAPVGETDFDRELLSLRDQLAESRAEDQAALVEHMTRLQSLRDVHGRGRTVPADPENPYFAHLRLREGDRVRDVLIGRRSFIDPRRDVHIVDWRNSPISRVYYRYEEGDEYEERFAGQPRSGLVEVRRTVTISGGRLMRVRAGDVLLVRDEAGDWRRRPLDASRLAGGQGTAIRPPAERLGRTGPDQRLPEITALIDPEQFSAITQERSGVVVIRGGAGTGKTTIALHRAAWLHFQDERRYAPKRMLIVTPGDALARYVARVLPALDVEGVPIKTFPTWAAESVKRLVPRLAKRKLTDDTPSEARRLKRHPALLRMLEKAVQAEARAWDEAFEAAGGEALLRAWVARRNLPPVQRVRTVTKWLESAGRGVVPNPAQARAALRQAAQELGDPVDTWATLLTDRARLQAGYAAAGERPYEWALDQLVETAARQSDDPPDYSHVDADRRAAVDGAALDEGDLTGRLDVDDLAILLRICQLKHGGLQGPGGALPPLEHLVVDEAQDLSPLSLQVLVEAARPGAPVTLAGDTAQRIHFDSGFDDWETLIAELRLDAHILPPLAVSYRSTRQVMALARHVLGPLAVEPSLRDAREGAPVELFRFAETGEAVAFLADSLKSLRGRERGASVALIARTPETAELYATALERAEVPALRLIRRQEFDFSPGIDVTDVYQVKGLEYDYVVVLDVTAEAWPPTTESRHLLHVAATRAAHQLWLVAAGRPSPLL